MSMKAILGTLFALILAVGGTAFLVARGSSPEPPPPVDIKKGDTVNANPFDLKAPGPHPKVVIPNKLFEFGVMALGGKQSHDFEIRNEGASPMRLAKGPVQCKCTIPALETDEIPPGGSTKIQLTWEPLGSSKDFRKEAHIWTNDPETPEIILTINGSVFDDPGVSPESILLGEIDWEKEQSSQVLVYSATSDDLEITGYEASDPKGFELSWTKLTPDELAAKAVGRSPKPVAAYHVDLKIKPNGTIGVFQGWVKLKVNRKDGEQTILISGVRVGLINLHGPDFQAGLALLDLKRFKSDQGGKTTMFMRLDPFGEDLKIVEVDSKSGHISANLVKKSSGGGKKDFYELVVEAKQGIPSGTTFTVDHPDDLTLKTNHPQVPLLHFNVRYIVQ